MEEEAYYKLLNKKGLVPRTIVNILIALLVLAILLFAISSLAKRSDEYLGRKTCLDSVNVLALSNRIGASSDFDLHCRTYDVNFEDEDEIEIKQKVADELFWCKWQFGAGDDGTNELDFISKMDPSENRCYVCSKISFNEELRKKYPYGITGVFGYMNDHEIPIGGGVTYSEYLIGEEGANFDPGQDKYYPLDQNYWVVLHAFKGNVLVNSGSWNTGDTVAWGGVAVGATMIATGVGAPIGVVVIGVSLGYNLVNNLLKDDRFYSAPAFYSEDQLIDTGICGKIVVFPSATES